MFRLAMGIDQRVTLHGLTWEQYEAILAMKGDERVPRMAFLDGELELMSPSVDHDRIKQWISHLLEVWLDEHSIDYDTAGSWTLRKKRRKRGVEPDDCFFIGRASDGTQMPDIAIEV